MPTSFEQARKNAGYTAPTYVPLAARENSGNTGLVSRIPGAYIPPASKPTDPPAKAPAAPSGNTLTVFTGLCDALNQFQQRLKEAHPGYIPDEYVIEFAGGLESSTIALKGQEYKASPTTQSDSAAAKLLPESNRVDSTGRVVPIGQGTQIVQFIDQVMRSSSFITDQSNWIIPESGDVPTLKPNAPKDADLMWYKISFQAIALEKDPVRNDYAYRMVYTVSPYRINHMESQYFPKGKYHGVHKSYSYWFTGQNNAVLNFEQDYDNQFFMILTGFENGQSNGKAMPYGLTNQPAPQSNISYSYAPASSQNNQGAANAANEIGASAADWLYASSKNGQVKIRIIGDPAWIQQGEVTNSINASTITFSPFLPDGTINFEGSEVMFDIYFNRPNDYDFNTGLVNVNGKNVKPDGTLSALQPQAHLTYVATSITSYFNHGKFEQELQGNLFPDPYVAASKQAKDAETARTAVKNNTVQGARPALLDADGNVTAESAANPDLWNDGTGADPTAATTDAGPITNAPNQPASPAKPPTSNGDIQPSNLPAPASDGLFGRLFNSGSYSNQVARTKTIQPTTTTQEMKAKDDAGK